MVFPDPDSPTTPTVSPSRSSKETPSTALMWSTVRLSKPRLIGNQTLRLSVATTTGPSGLPAGGLPLGSAAIRWRV